MKSLALLLALLFAQYSIAGLPPTSLKGQSGSKFTNFNFEVPANQATKTSTGGLLETGNANLLTNPNFEHATTPTGWTMAVTGTTLIDIVATTDTSLVYPDGGKKSAILSCSSPSTGGTCSFKQEVTTIEAAGVVKACLAIEAGATVSLYSLHNGGRQTELSVTEGDLLADGKWHCYEIPTVLGSTTTGIEVLVTVAAGVIPNIYADSMKVAAGKVTGSEAVVKEDLVLYAAGNGGQAYTVGTAVPFILVSDNSGSWDGTQYTIPEDGVYSITTHVIFTASAGRAVNLFIDGVEKKRIGETVSNSNHHGEHSGYFKAGEVVTIRIGGNGGTLLNDAIHHHLSIIKQARLTTSKTYSQQCQTDLECTNEFSAKVSATGVVSDESLDWISGDCAKGGTGLYDCSFVSTVFSVAPNCVTTHNGGEQFFTSVGSTTDNTIRVRVMLDNSANTDKPFNIICTKQGADFQATKTIKGSFHDYVKSIGSTSGADIQSVYFGSGADCSSLCTTGTCVICNQVGNKITSVTFVSTGQYNINGIDGKKYSCTGGGHSSGVAYISAFHHLQSSTSTFARFLFGNASTLHDTAHAAITCLGDLE
jgi:hypothetical protein